MPVFNNDGLASQSLLEVFRTSAEVASIELVVVDDCSKDRLWELERLMQQLRDNFGTRCVCVLFLCRLATVLCIACVLFSCNLPILQCAEQSVTSTTSADPSAQPNQLVLLAIDLLTICATPSLFELVLSCRSLMLRNPTNQGFGASVNYGMREASGRFAVILNTDAFVVHGWLAALLHTFAMKPDAGLVGPLFLGQQNLVTEAGGIVFR